MLPSPMQSHLRRLDFVELLIENGAEITSVPLADVLLTWEPIQMRFFSDRGADPIKGFPFATAFGAKVRTAMPHSSARDDADRIRGSGCPWLNWSSSTRAARIKEHKKRLFIDAVKESGGNNVGGYRCPGVLGVHSNYQHRLIRNLKLREA